MPADAVPYPLVGPDGQAHSSSTPGTLGGHCRSRIYGRLDCRSSLRALTEGGYEAHRVFFADETASVAAGYRPCGVCLPERYAIWKALRCVRTGPALEPAATRAAYTAARQLQDRFGALNRLGSVVIGHSREATMGEAARWLGNLLERHDVEVRDVVDWPETAASWLRQANRFTASAPELWVVLVGADHGWMRMRQRLRHTDWDPARTAVIATEPDHSVQFQDR